VPFSTPNDCSKAPNRPTSTAAIPQRVLCGVSPPISRPPGSFLGTRSPSPHLGRRDFDSRTSSRRCPPHIGKHAISACLASSLVQIQTAFLFQRPDWRVAGFLRKHQRTFAQRTTATRGTVSLTRVFAFVTVETVARFLTDRTGLGAIRTARVARHPHGPHAYPCI